MKDWSISLCIGLVTCLVTLVVLTATLGASFVTEDDVSRQVATESPYVRDRSLILFRLERIEKKLDTLLEIKAKTK